MTLKRIVLNLTKSALACVLAAAFLAGALPGGESLHAQIQKIPSYKLKRMIKKLRLKRGQRALYIPRGTRRKINGFDGKGNDVRVKSVTLRLPNKQRILLFPNGRFIQYGARGRIIRRGRFLNWRSTRGIRVGARAARVRKGRVGLRRASARWGRALRKQALFLIYR